MTEYLVTETDINFFKENGFLVISDFISDEQVKEYQETYKNFVDGKIDVGGNRRDLNGQDEKSKTESITQILVPSRYLPELLESSYYKRISNTV